jgi:hypothetical protein
MLNIVVKYRQESVDGIHLTTLKSALQKYIRRGNLDKALWTASRLDSFADVEGGERIRTNFLHRLMIIFLEDIGFVGLEHWKQLDTLLYQICIRQRKTKSRQRSREIWAIKNAIKIMCGLKKARSCSHLNAVITADNSIIDDTPYKDLVVLSKLDCSDIKKRLGYAKYVYSLTDSDKFDKLAEHYGVDIMDICRRWFKEITTKEQFTTWSILLTNLVYNTELDRKIKLLSLENEDIILDTDWSSELAIPTCEYDAYVYDKHTLHGKDRTTKYFAETSSVVIPESPLVDAWSKYIYLRLRGSNPEKPSINIYESQFARFVSRVQLTTSNGKTDVYLADIGEHDTYIIKGPFHNDSVIAKYLEYQVEKESYGMATLENKIVYMIPDRWPEGVPLGVRNVMDRQKAYPFLVVKSLLHSSEFVYRTHKSALWPDTQVIDPYKCSVHFDNLDCLSENQRVDFLNSLGFRLKYKLSDLGLRNFLIHGDRLYSIDEESVNMNFSLINELKKNNYTKVRDYYTKLKDRVNPHLVEYLEKEFTTI